MNVSMEEPAEPMGIVAGVILLAAGLGILARMPWQFTPGSVLAPIVQIVGSVAIAAVGVALMFLVLRA